ncbi:SDR family oxidoreductase [Rhodopirellula sp. JC740]|uniref:SDR family oxidoreductase n=2 Tax=Rhodopirellula halodulae TaxID=2894198 RepID=A0ABS8NG04_9BACT|nr:SDR family oxidoreductase [Rhodopirellula sp. JC740]
MPHSPSLGMPLITGASGMLGSYVMAEMLRAGRLCAVLVRGKGKQSASQRVDHILNRYETAWQTKLVRPTILEGDLLQPGLGLSNEAIDWASQNCDRILHSAASLSFLPADPEGDNEPYRTNVDGTREVIAMARRMGIPQFHHVSTAYVCGKRSGRVKESEGDVGQSFANDYERSKLIAEGIVREAFAGRGLTIYRPSIVIDRTGLSPVSGDRTIYGAFSMYQMLASRFGLPSDGQWFRDLGFAGNECKNIVDVDWIARAICKIISTPRLHGRTYHLTTRDGSSIESLDAAFHTATTQWLATRKPDRVSASRPSSPNRSASPSQTRKELDQMADPFVKTFLPYFRDDPTFDRENIDDVIATTHLDDTPAIGTEELLQMISNWTAPTTKQPTGKKRSARTADSAAEGDKRTSVARSPEAAISEGNPNDCVICGFEVRLPGGVDNARAFEEMLFDGRSVIAPMPSDRLDRELYFDSKRGVPGKTYTQLGGCVSPAPLDPDVERQIESLGTFDLTHRQFAQVAVAAMKSASAANQSLSFDPMRAGVFVGHSGGTELGGPLAMATMADTAMELVEQTSSVQALDAGTREGLKRSVANAIRQDRPRHQANHLPEFNAYSAASLAARMLGFQGRREVIDAACSSSLLALQHAASAIEADRIDLAVVGGATFNNVDNLALFSQSGACSETGSYPFDNRASGLISSEGYVAVVIARRSVAEANQMPILATLRGVGVASDGKGKGLWAPRSEGQQTAMQRAVDSQPLNIDYLECHATSTQVGDATELESLTQLLAGKSGNGPLPIGSVKSNLGHLLEAAGLVGVAKCLLAIQRGEIPPSINFSQPTERHDWQNSPVRIVDRVEPWTQRTSSRGKVAAVNAFGIGGLNAHAVIEEKPSTTLNSRTTASSREAEPIAIVGRGVVLPDAPNLDAFRELLTSSRSAISDPPPGRWMQRAADGAWIGVTNRSQYGEIGYSTPHCRGGYIRDFKFDAQSYRIPPKMVANANPAQLMLIEAVRQAMDEFDGGQWSVDRQKVGVVVGTIFGGQFSNELQVGLRLPEITRLVTRQLRELGWSDLQAQATADELRQVTLDKYGALLDETGGFTASTLASRIARTFDLMGGAFAVDADEASGGLALITAMEQLHAGKMDLAICGVTQRGMDLVAFEQLARKNQLLTTGHPRDLPHDGSQIIPGEGVAVLTLQRLSDAKANGRKILGILTKPTESFTSDVRGARAAAAQDSERNQIISARKLVGQIGHLGGAQGIVRTIAATLSTSFGSAAAPHEAIRIHEVADDGYQVNYSVAPQMNYESASLSSDESTLISPSTALESRSESTPSPNFRENVVAATSQESGDCITTRIQCFSFEALQAALGQIAEGVTPNDSVVEQFDSFSHRCYRAVLLGDNQQEIAAAASAALSGPIRERKSGGLVRHDGWVWIPSSRPSELLPRAAWLFPGQGSQYAEAPAWLKSSDAEASRAFLQSFDGELQAMGLPAVSDRLHDPDQQLGRDVWWTQAWVLAVGSMFSDALLRSGLRPDVVLGHSFGECTAAWCAGVVSTRQAIEFAKSRSDSVVMTTRERGELLSVRGAPSQVDAALLSSDIQYTISHHNSRQQTVIAGSPDQMRAAKETLASAGMASVVIPVPAAFHTPEMMPAQEMLRARFTGQNARPPRFAFLSAVSNRYLAEPADIVDNLVTQLTRPVCFSGAVERLAHDGCELMVEVGPNNVLTRLAGSTVEPHVLCLSADERGRAPHRQLKLLKLAYEALGQTLDQTVSPSMATPPASPPRHTQNGHVAMQNGHATSAPVNAATTLQTQQQPTFEVVDVTRRSRRQADQCADPQNDASNMNPMLSTSLSSNGSASQATIDSPIAPPSPATVAPTKAANAMASPASTATDLQHLQSARSFLFDLVVDLTGYDPEVIEFDADLEAELGVDSIKKAQLIGEIVQWGNLEVDTQSMRLAQFASLNDILQLVGDPSSIEDAPEPSTAYSNQASPGTEALPQPESGSDLADSLKRLMIDLVVDQTGYDEDIIDMDADLEAELGIDSIKRAQLLGELEQQYELQSLRQSNLKLSDFPTLSSIHTFVMDQIEEREPSSEKKNASLNERPTAESGERDAPATGTHRFVMRTRKANRRDGMPTSPNLNGAALILGDNDVADSLARRCREQGVEVYRLNPPSSMEALDAELDRIWQIEPTPHLFLTTPYDAGACWSTFDVESWRQRHADALATPYRVCQRWMQQMIDDDRMGQSSLVTTLKLGGEFGFDAMTSAAQSNVAIHSRSAESGGLAGLTKAMLIEAWMRGFRDTPMLVVEGIDGASADEIADGVFRELAVPSYDEEVAAQGPERFAPRAVYQPLDISSQQPPRLTRGGNWVVAGGGRGITAMTAMELARRHDLKLHLLGMAPVPQIDAEMRAHAKRDRAELRRVVMARIQKEGGNPVKTWRQLEKAIEIDLTLEECRERSIQATYHSVNVSDAEAVQAALSKIRSTDGPIRGVIQGAGSGQDARFDRKRPDKVAQCFSAKVDGTISLAAATQNDPLEWFIGYGSISGRFGANGHTDYSAANDMLAKLIGRLRQQRPETRCVTFHWHAWGDVGMATKPEAKLALDMIGMEFMPAEEGLQHFLREVEHGGNEAEVLITDRRYVRKFFPSESSRWIESPDRPSPMLDPTERIDDSNPETFAVTLHPQNDLFLKDHLVVGRPTLPFVMAIEMLAEAARWNSSQQVIRCRDVVASMPLKFATDDPLAIEILNGDASSSDRWSLVSDLRRKDGRLVQSRRQHFSAAFDLGSPITQRGSIEVARVEELPVPYVDETAPVYHGPSLQCLRSIGFLNVAGSATATSTDKPVAVGTIVAPSPAHLAGESRPLMGWVLSPATMDAVLYAAGMLAYRVGGNPSLPISFNTIDLGRLPDPGEPLRVQVRWEEDIPGNGPESAAGGRLSALLLGQNQDVILQLHGYRVGWLR